MTISLNGVMPPIPTPFDDAGDVALDKLALNIERWNCFDLAGYVVLGSNGEASYLNWEEKLTMFRTARAMIPSDKLFIAGTGCEGTQQTVAMTCMAADVGADAALVVTPNYYDGNMDDTAMIAHYTVVADESPIPVILYNVPKFTHVILSVPTIKALAQHPNIIGMKDSSGNIAKFAETLYQTPDDFQILAGSASFLFPAVALGGVGAVAALANIAPQQCIDLYNLTVSGHSKQAAKLQQRLIAPNAAVTSRFGIAGLKAAMDMLDWYGGPVRSPLQPLDGDNIALLEQALIEAGIL